MQEPGSRTSLQVLIVYTCGCVAALLTFGYLLTGWVVEASGPWRDVARLLVPGVLLAFLSAAPYFLLVPPTRQSGRPTRFAGISVFMLAFQLAFSIKALVFARGSTEVIGLLLLPLYLMAFVIALRIVLALARRHRAPQ